MPDGASTFGVTLSGGRHAFVPRFEPVEVLQTIQMEKVTHAQFVPTMINMLVNHRQFPEFDIGTLSFILYGASPMPEGVLRKAMELMPHVRLMHGYGMTEASPIVTLLDPRYTVLDGPFAGRLKSCGQVVLACEIKVVDADRKEVPALETTAEEQARERVDNHLLHPHADAAEARGGFVRTDGENVAAKNRLPQQHRHDNRQRHGGGRQGGRLVQGDAAGQHRHADGHILVLGLQNARRADVIRSTLLRRSHGRRRNLHLLAMDGLHHLRHHHHTGDGQGKGQVAEEA